MPGVCSLVKVPVTPGRIPKLEADLTGFENLSGLSKLEALSSSKGFENLSGFCTRRYSAGGQVCWIAAPGPLEALDGILSALELIWPGRAGGAGGNRPSPAGCTGRHAVRAAGEASARSARAICQRGKYAEVPLQHTIRVETLGPQGPAMASAIESCVHCGFCLPACPTYRVLGEEMDSPRGRIVLMKSALEGGLTVEETLPYIDRCLGCLGCVTACPSGVHTASWSPPTAPTPKPTQLRGRSWSERAGRWCSRRCPPRPVPGGGPLGSWARPLARAGSRPTLRPMLSACCPRAARGGAAARDLSRAGDAAARAWRCWPGASSRRWTPRSTGRRCGCWRQRRGDGDPRRTRVLRRAGHAPGGTEPAQAFARRNLARLPADVDAIVTNAAGCGSGMNEYRLLFAGEPEQDAPGLRAPVGRRERVPGQSASLTPPPLPQPLNVAYHDACHLAHAQGVTGPPRRLLRSIPNLTLLEIQEGEICCGSAGTYNIEQPEIAASSAGERRRTSSHRRRRGRGRQHRLPGPDRDAPAGPAGRCPSHHTMQVLDMAYAPSVMTSTGAFGRAARTRAHACRRPFALRHRNYRLWFMGQGLSLIGTWMPTMAQQVLRLPACTGSAVALGIISDRPDPADAAGAMGRLHRRSRAEAHHHPDRPDGHDDPGVHPGRVAWTGAVQVWHVYVLAFVLAAAQAVDLPARQAFTVELVEGKEDLINAIGLNSAMFNGARAIGPALAGTLVAALGEGPAFLLNGLSFVAVIISLLLMRNLPAPPGCAATPASTGHMAEGIRFILQPADHHGADQHGGGERVSVDAVQHADAGLREQGAANQRPAGRAFPVRRCGPADALPHARGAAARPAVDDRRRRRVGRCVGRGVAARRVRRGRWLTAGNLAFPRC